jgi:hypothetical protein
MYSAPGGRDFDRNHRLRPGLQSLAREIAAARSAIQHDISGVNETLAFISRNKIPAGKEYRLSTRVFLCDWPVIAESSLALR